MRLQRAREQQAFLRELREAGWKCELNVGTYFFRTPGFWELVIDSNYLDRIEYVYYFDDMIYEDDGEIRFDITPLLELKNLKVLSLNNTQVSDMTPLVKLNLERLFVSDTQISDLTPLRKIKNLVWLDVSNTKVTDEQIQQLQKALPYCHIEH